jgi:hypothetical protein
MNRDYHWPSKMVLTLLVVACLLGAAITGWPRATVHWPGPLRALGSGDTETLLALMLALFVAIRFYQRADAGTLDGDEHYNVARALAFGYFKNFLVPALRLAEQDNEHLYVFCPQSMDDLTAYSTEIEPRVRSLFDHDWQPVVPQPEHGAPRRTVLVVRRRREPITTGEGPTAPFMFDAPTALFTVQDFYAALNRRRLWCPASPSTRAPSLGPILEPVVVAASRSWLLRRALSVIGPRAEERDCSLHVGCRARAIGDSTIASQEIVALCCSR